MHNFCVVIPTFNSIAFIGECLKSVFAQGRGDIDVVVADNASSDGTADFIRKNYPQVVLIENKENLGACRARNQGIEISKSPWVVCLDCDVVLENDFFSEVNGFISSIGARTGIIQPKILDPSGKAIYSCGIHLSKLRRFFDIGRNEPDSVRFDGLRVIFGACSAAAVYRRAMLDEIKEKTGYFDERFFFLVEDVDLSWRARRSGWEAVFFPKARCRHNGGSSGFGKQLRQRLCFRNRYYSIAKNEGLSRYSMRIMPVLFYDIPRFIYLWLFNRSVVKVSGGRTGK